MGRVKRPDFGQACGRCGGFEVAVIETFTGFPDGSEFVVALCSGCNRQAAAKMKWASEDGMSQGEIALWYRSWLAGGD